MNNLIIPENQQEQVRTVAYFNWLEAGQQGDEVQHWLNAEQKVLLSQPQFTSQKKKDKNPPKHGLLMGGASGNAKNQKPPKHHVGRRNN